MAKLIKMLYEKLVLGFVVGAVFRFVLIIYMHFILFFTKEINLQ